ncbi:ABC transporter ATP-binding protein [Candidatus Accumulibacter vicinus]|uniref:LIV-I protein F n=1 Tax=Candidatus Accumulibacter vicinus TaxID=2954382 RepID=A0A084XXU9_9PROT|nr:ABC transporter ATP-binding protein [Candidatus Accumulibacter vicinus]KFB67293.1 MAG: LIV-I protein F [Candidatus Accumulibacter vicinus]
MLEVNGLRVSYGGIQAVRGITFHVNEGEMVALIGANGAGKSSTLRALSRLLDPIGGSVRYRGKELLALPPHRLVGEGIALVPEGRGVFPRMSSLENLRMGAYARNNKTEIENDLEQVLVHFPRLKERAQQLAGTLSGGEQQMLAIGRAMMSKPRLLLLDEPSMGLAPIMVQKIFEVICAVASEGMTILLVEQNAKLALEVSQRGYVMESGEITLTNESKALLTDPKVRASYLGE